ncbi:MAG: type II toxin-antitoxin system YoeB family toxin, partial [Prevotella sp.]|nr:type II toxin-antitoxin system YoeB family toxin [Prevotella sp.]
MTYEIKLKKSVEKAVTKWKKSNPRLHKKFKEILYELLEHPRTGIGHPEALIGGNDIRWSRHVTAHDRIIYDIYDDIVVVEVVQI